MLPFDLPAAPQELDFDGTNIIWGERDDLGNCAPADKDVAGENSVEPIAEVTDIITAPAGLPVAAFEVVIESDVE